MVKQGLRVLGSLLFEDLVTSYLLIKNCSTKNELEDLKKAVADSKNGGSFYYGENSVRIIDRESLSYLLDMAIVDIKNRADMLSCMEEMLSSPKIYLHFTEINPECFNDKA